MVWDQNSSVIVQLSAVDETVSIFYWNISLVPFSYHLCTWMTKYFMFDICREDFNLLYYTEKSASALLPDKCMHSLVCTLLFVLLTQIGANSIMKTMNFMRNTQKWVKWLLHVYHICKVHCYDICSWISVNCDNVYYGTCI